jgi:hypothetical protein
MTPVAIRLLTRTPDFRTKRQSTLNRCNGTSQKSLGWGVWHPLKDHDPGNLLTIMTHAWCPGLDLTDGFTDGAPSRLGTAGEKITVRSSGMTKTPSRCLCKKWCLKYILWKTLDMWLYVTLTFRYLHFSPVFIPMFS